jgi:hypothetical protein
MKNEGWAVDFNRIETKEGEFYSTVTFYPVEQTLTALTPSPNE